MPRAARKTSDTGIYHVMMRGINRQIIFEEAEDYEKMKQVILDCREKSGFELYAYCLMSDHIHLLLKEKKEPLGIIFRRIGSQYVYWYNTKYSRTGHLFQDRFRSEPVETDDYLLTVLRYIHRNPVKAGMADRPEEYAYSSFRGYTEGKSEVDGGYILDLLPRERFEEFHEAGWQDKCLDMSEDEVRRVTDEDALRIMRKITNCDSCPEFRALEQGKRARLIVKMNREGLSLRQISRLTGETVYGIQKCLSDKEPSPV